VFAFVEGAVKNVFGKVLAFPKGAVKKMLASLEKCWHSLKELVKKCWQA
jgi:hypothetical protein